MNKIENEHIEIMLHENIQVVSIAFAGDEGGLCIPIDSLKRLLKENYEKKEIKAVVTSDWMKAGK